ncbi:MAG: hypothetical protein U5N85_02750 [Arcicella sp.]|nr:hypothetical protein [Arcicella sp.]
MRVALTSLTVTPSPVGTVTYRVGCRNSTGCETLPANRASVNITVNGIPNAPTNAGSSTDPSICVGVESTTLTATCSAGETPQWYTSCRGIIYQLNGKSSGNYGLLCRL